MSHRQLWYVRRGDKVSGPFPTQVVANNTLLGRFLPGDEVSLDQLEWKPLVSVAELLPPELLELHNETDPERRQWLEERLKAARRWADQRTHDERRHAGEVAVVGCGAKYGVKPIWIAKFWPCRTIMRRCRRNRACDVIWAWQ